MYNILYNVPDNNYVEILTIIRFDTDCHQQGGLFSQQAVFKRCPVAGSSRDTKGPGKKKYFFIIRGGGGWGGCKISLIKWVTFTNRCINKFNILRITRITLKNDSVGKINEQIDRYSAFRLSIKKYMLLKN